MSNEPLALSVTTNLIPFSALTSGSSVGDTLYWTGTEWETQTSFIFADNVFRISDNLDATKKLALDISYVPTATTTTMIAPNYNGILPARLNNSIYLGNPTYVTTGASNVFLGVDAGIAQTTSWGNVLIGHQAMSDADFGEECVAIGYQSQRYNASYGNTSIGFQTLINNETGNSCTAVGHGALYGSTVNSNIGIGFAAGAGITTGRWCIGLGTSTMTAACTGDGNIAIGHLGLSSLTNGTYNTTLGFLTATNLTTGASNTAIGSYIAMDSNARTGAIVIGSGATSRNLNHSITLGNATVEGAVVAATGDLAATHTISIKIGDNVYRLLARNP